MHVTPASPLSALVSHSHHNLFQHRVMSVGAMRVVSAWRVTTRVWNRAVPVELSVVCYELFHREWLAMPGAYGVYFETFQSFDTGIRCR